jgi:hypothetical protein
MALQDEQQRRKPKVAWKPGTNGGMNGIRLEEENFGYDDVFGKDDAFGYEDVFCEE